MIPILFEKSQDVGVSTSGYLAAIITAGIRVLGGVFGIFLIRTLPRVRLAMLSLTILSVSMIVLGTVYYLKQFYDQNAALDVLPTIFVPLYMFSYGAGVFYKHSKVYQIMLG